MEKLLSVLKGRIQEDLVKREKYEYINKVYQNISRWYGREIHAENYIYCRDINSSPYSLTTWGIILGCCGNGIKKKIPEE